MADELRARMETMVRAAQEQLCHDLAELDGGTFREDIWTREEGGGGTSRILQDGAVFEKAGVNVSAVWGTLSDEAARSMAGGAVAGGGESASRRFFATGLSVVIHPHNPMAPTAHCNYRYFETGSGSWWFGGGADLTPSYLFEEDAQHFHRVHKEVCDKHDPEFYPRFKRWCDEYFMIEHRGERRGVGGIFFDGLNDRDPDTLFGFATDCARAFSDAYLPILRKRIRARFNKDHKRWQSMRRGRYVEFNLVYDRGTTFGLRTGGRTESILMSLPLSARWEYDYAPPVGSPEAKLVDVLREPRDWV
jgi:coproporphyrinogen III oxidase